jgi:hypothetical protein
MSLASLLLFFKKIKVKKAKLVEPIRRYCFAKIILVSVGFQAIMRAARKD